MKRKKILRIALSAVFAIAIAVSLFQIIKIYIEDRESAELNNSLVSEVVVLNTKAPSDSTNKTPQTEDAPPLDENQVPIYVDFNALFSKNEDIIAWVYCPNTPINYPIVKGEDNDYYLRRLLDGTKNIAGTLFADFKNSADFSDHNTIIYGHNMRNDTMFGTLPDYAKQKYYNAHPVWYLLTPEANYKVELVAGFITPDDSEIYRITEDRKAIDAQVAIAIKKSKFKSGVTIESTDKLVTFSTCTYEYKNARFVLIGVLRELEK